MNLKQINPENLSINPYKLFERQSLLLTCGDFSQNRVNCMTIGWGSTGSMWNKPYVVVVVRPSRYTFEFMENFNDFSVTAFPENQKEALKILGSRSGRDLDKINLAGLTPIPSQLIKSPTFVEAELSIECKKVYWQDLDPSHFLDPNIERSYPRKDYHRVYYGEIINIMGTDQYIKYSAR